MQYKKFDNDENLTIFEKDVIELVQALGNKRKSHRFYGGCIKWWANACYLRTNQLSNLMVLTERINALKNKIKGYKPYLF